MQLKYSTPWKYKGFREVGKEWFCTEGISSTLSIYRNLRHN